MAVDAIPAKTTLIYSNPLTMRALVLTSLFVLGIPVLAQPAADAPKPPRQQRAPRSMSDMIKPLEESGFTSIFDGKSLAGWDADPAFWRVEDGAIVGQTATDKQPKQNTFCIWRGGSPANFELKLKYKLTGFNSGIQYRSIELPNIKYAMKGYQADIDGQQTYTGQIYEERGRGFLALRGQATYIGENGKPGVIGKLGGSDGLKWLIRGDDWNDLHIIARGNPLIQILNGRVMAVVIDDDATGRKLDGLLGIQVHLGPPMKIEVKDIRLKNL